MTSCSDCQHHDRWAGDEICSQIEHGKADADQDHYLVRRAFQMDDPSGCPMKKEKAA